MKKIIVVLVCILSTVIYAEENEQLNALREEVRQIIVFAQQQESNCQQEYQSLTMLEVEDDLWMDTLQSDEKIYRDVREHAERFHSWLVEGKGGRIAAIHLQLLRNTLYAYAPHEELKTAGIKKRTKSVYQSSKEFASNSSSLLIKISGTIVALKTIYDYTPYIIESICSKMLLK